MRLQAFTTCAAVHRARSGAAKTRMSIGNMVDAGQCTWPVLQATICRRQCQDVPDHWWVGYNKVLQCHTEPFLLQFCDRRIVHRSNALLGGSYGERKHFALPKKCDSAVQHMVHDSCG